MGASSFTKTAKPDVGPGTPAALTASHFSPIYLSMVFPVFKTSSQTRILDGISTLLKDKKEKLASLSIISIHSATC